MYSNAPENYICPFCLVVQKIENEHVFTKQDDVFYTDEHITAFIPSHGFKKNMGHAVIIPNQHYENIYCLPSHVSYKIHDFEKELALAFKKVYNCDGVSSRQHNEHWGNQDVWHYHLHVFPRYKNDDLYFSKREFIEPDERKVYADMLKKYFMNFHI